MSIIAQRMRIESLDCIVIDGGPAPRIPVVICHGYGASCDDLAPLAGEWIRLLDDKAQQFRFVFPNAPFSLAELGAPEARAWWHINLDLIAAAAGAGQIGELLEHEPDGIDDVREMLCGVVRHLKNDLADETAPLVLGGFSQGSMLTMDTSLRGDIDPPAVLFQLSGTIICKSKWVRGLTRLKHTYVYQSHGTFDPILPFAHAEELRDLLISANIDVQFHSFPGPHTVDPESIALTAQALARLT